MNFPNNREEFDKTVSNLGKEDMVKLLQMMYDETASLKKTVDTLKEVVNGHQIALEQMHEAETLDKTLSAIQDSGKRHTKAEEFVVYCVDSKTPESFFYVNDNGDRSYIPLKEKPLLAKALETKEVLISNHNYRNDPNANNTMAIPVLDDNGNHLGVMIAEGKTEFTAKDAEAMDLKNGSIGAIYGLGLESKINKAQAQNYKKQAQTSKFNYPNEFAMEEFVATSVFERTRNYEATTVMFFDIDRFKTFNDKYSYDVGDRCIQHVLDTIAENLRCDEKTGVFHLHGEEICAILPVDETKAFAIAERIRQSIEEKPFVIEEFDAVEKITVSVGLGEFNLHNSLGVTKENIADRFHDKAHSVAEQNMHVAKKSGRNTVYGSPELMQTHQSEPSPTVVFKNFLDTYKYELSYNADGYHLLDTMNGQDQGLFIRRDMQTVQEVLSAIRSHEIENTLVADLNSLMYDYCDTHGVDANEMAIVLPDARDADCMKQWTEFASELSEKSEYYGDFLRENKSLLSMAKVLSTQAEDIRMDYVAINLDRDYEAQEKNSEEKRQNPKGKPHLPKKEKKEEMER